MQFQIHIDESWRRKTGNGAAKSSVCISNLYLSVDGVGKILIGKRHRSAAMYLSFEFQSRKFPARFHIERRLARVGRSRISEYLCRYIGFGLWVTENGHSTVEDHASDLRQLRFLFFFFFQFPV